MSLPARVLVGRPPELAAPWLEVLRDAGVAAEALPLVAIEPLEPTPKAAAALARPGDFAWILFPSRNAVELFFARLGPSGWPAGTRAGVVGPGTGQALAERGVETALVAPEGTGRSLAEAFLALGQPPAATPVLLAAARGGRTEIQDALRAAGHPVTVVELYRTVAVAGPPPLAGAVVLLFSPSGARSLAARVPEPHNQEVWAIGPTTAAAAAKAGFAVAAVLAERTPEALRQVLQQQSREA